MALTSAAQGGKDFLLKIGNNFSGAVTFQGTGETVTKNNHGLVNGDRVKFSTVTTTTTVNTTTTYFVVTSTTNTFQLSLTAGGSAVLIDVDGTGVAEEVFSTLGGLRSTTFSASSGEIDITNQESAQWTELLDAAGISAVSLSGDGVFKDEFTFKRARAAFLARQLRTFRIFTNTASDYWSGTFRIGSLEQTGGHDNEQTYSISLSSSGPVTYTEV
jgi:TP901-1 family phage major tail protein